MDNKKEFKVASFQKGQTKNGKEMWRISLLSIEDEKPLTGVIWSEDIPRFDGSKFKVGNIIKFLGQDYNSNYNSVVIKNVTVIKEALTGLPKELEERYLKDITGYLSMIEQKYSKKPTKEDTHSHLPLAILARELQKDIKNQAFKITPAAERYHHNYLGGLLRHTYEVWTLTRSLCKEYKIEKADELQVAAILHDLGKMLEYITDTKLGTATIDQEWQMKEISHIHWAYRYAHDCGCFDVARMVACHHGKVEWGALFEPETVEEKVLHLADMISAAAGTTTIDKLEAMIANIAIEQQAQEREQETDIIVKKEEMNVHPTSTDII